VTAAAQSSPARRPATVDRLTRHRRRARLSATLASASVRRALVPVRSERGRQRARVCRAARILTALGVRVQVVQPAVPWPRTDRFVVTDSVSWLGDLALVTVVRGMPHAATTPGAVPCPVVVRYRTADGYLAPEDVPRTLDDVLAARDLVIEVRLQAVPVAPAAA
jgi:hypothetical protein